MNSADTAKPLLCVFSAEDMERLQQGKCLVSDASADESVSFVLTHPFHRDFQLALAEWFRLADRKGCGEYFRARLRTTVNNWPRFLQTVGELTAGYFLHENLDEKVEYRCAQKGADFNCSVCGLTIACEVKTAVGGISSAPQLVPVPPNTPRLRRLLDACRKQLETEHTNLALLVDWWSPLIEPYHLLQAMYGTRVMAMWIGPSGPVGEWRPERLRNGKCGPKQMTRIGAVGVINGRGTDCRARAWFIHNLHARNRISLDVLDPWSQLVPTEEGVSLQWRNGTPEEPRPGRN